MISLRVVAISCFFALIAYFYRKDFSSRTPPVDIIGTGHGRIVAVGDLHGDYQNAIKTLQMAGLVDKKHNWNGGNTIFVQTGDIVDRGDDTILLFKLFQKIERQAKRSGGLVVQLLGKNIIPICLQKGIMRSGMSWECSIM